MANSEDTFQILVEDEEQVKQVNKFSILLTNDLSEIGMKLRTLQFKKRMRPVMVKSVLFDGVLKSTWILIATSSRRFSAVKLAYLRRSARICRSERKTKEQVE